jgi:prostaglandin-endoperoxide synthase 2
VGFTLLNTLFLREHNRVAGALADAYPGWDDERLFQTARTIMIVLLIKIVIEEYINHITPYHFRLAADPTPFVSERWIRPNWMAIEFNLLYRWHGLIPPRLHGEPVWKTIFNPAMVVERGVAALIDDASRTRANRIGVFNTDPPATSAPRRPCTGSTATSTASSSSRACSPRTRARTPSCRR